MLCEKCGIRNATMHIRTIVNGQLHEKHLCSLCAANGSYNSTNASNVTQILSSILNDDILISAKQENTRCSCCGSSFNDIIQSGKCGCAQCYTTFYEKLLPYFKRAQYGGINHGGKTIENAKNTLNKSDESVNDLKNLLKQLVAEEKYEEAAVVRDKIKLLEGEKL